MTTKPELTRESVNHIQWECQQLLNKVTTLTDRCDWERLAECYTEDGVLYRPSDASNGISGRDNIYRSFVERPPKETCHMLANTVFTVNDETQVIAESRVWLISGAKQTSLPIQASNKLLAGRFLDELKFIDGKWHIAERKGSIELSYDYLNKAD